MEGKSEQQESEVRHAKETETESCSRERIELEEGERKVKEICGSQYEKLRIDEERRREGEEDEDEELRRRICQK